MGLLGLIFYAILFAIFYFIVYIAWTLRQRAAYYKKHGVAYLGPGWSRNWKTITGELNLMSFDEAIYKDAKKTNAPIVAVTDLTGQSSIIIMEPEIIKRILVKDSDHFINTRPVETKTSSKYLSKMLFVMQDEQWKLSRAKMTPAFTTGKIKKMFQMFTSSGERMDKFVKEQMGYPNFKSMDIDFFKLLFKFSMDVIASCAFGIDSKSWETKLNEFSTFEQQGKNFEFKFDALGMMKIIIINIAPKLADMLELEILDYKSQMYFASIVKEELKRRRQTGERKEDFLQLMMDIQQGILKADEEDGEAKKEVNSAANKMVFDDEYLIANALMFFLVGFDTTQTVLQFGIYSLGLEQEVQEKLYQEVKSVIDKHGGKMTYESLFEMPYLDMVINETMRMYPAATRLDRTCNTDYVVEETGFKIKKGELVTIPTHGIHTDAKYYPNPEKFIPERFTAENKAARHPYVYMAFGHGPRSCIGMRFAMLKIKAVFAQVILAYKLAPCSKTNIPVKFDGSASAKPTGGTWLNVTARD